MFFRASRKDTGEAIVKGPFDELIFSSTGNQLLGLYPDTAGHQLIAVITGSSLVVDGNEVEDVSITRT